MARWTVLIPDRLTPPADVEEAVLGPEVEVVLGSASNTSKIPDRLWRMADGILAWHEIQISREVVAKLDRCKAIVRCGVGYDNVDLQAAGERGIPVCNVPDYGTNDVADHAVALILTLARGVYAFSEKVRESNQYWNWGAAGNLHRLTGATLGIIGLGRIGTAVALRAKTFGMRVVAYDPYIPDGRDKALGVERVYELKGLLPQADIISFHTPLTQETRYMADEAFFAMLKPGAIVVNTARGPIIKLDALEAALRDNSVGAAGLDVVEMEPPEPTHPLVRAWRNREEWIAYRLVITPHAAFVCEEAYNELRLKAAMTARRALEGAPLRNVVNASFLKHRL